MFSKKTNSCTLDVWMDQGVYHTQKVPVIGPKTKKY